MVLGEDIRLDLGEEEVKNILPGSEAEVKEGAPNLDNIIQNLMIVQ